MLTLMLPKIGIFSIIRGLLNKPSPHWAYAIRPYHDLLRRYKNGLKREGKMPSVLDPNSPQAKAISDLLITILVMGLGIFLLVTGVIIYFLIRYRHRPVNNRGEPRQVAGNNRLEIGWTVGALVLVIIIFILTVQTMTASDPPAPKGQPVDLQVIAHQWWWEFRYPQLNIITANELHIPIGQKLRIELKSADVIHDFWVPQLARKIDVEPNRTNAIWIQSDTPGVFFGACAEYCGEQHAWMLFQVKASPQGQYDAWVRQQQQPAPAPTALLNGGDPVKGAQVFKQNACAACHAITGTDATGQLGPNLSHFGGRSIIGAGVLQNTPENLTRWIKNAPAVKPGVFMPVYNQLNDEDLRNLVAYIEGLK
jgi:cytochrome c oxidase subunit 2